METNVIPRFSAHLTHLSENRFIFLHSRANFFLIIFPKGKGDIKEKEEKILIFKRSEEELKLTQYKSLTEEQKRELKSLENKLAEKDKK